MARAASRLIETLRLPLLVILGAASLLALAYVGFLMWAGWIIEKEMVEL